MSSLVNILEHRWIRTVILGGQISFILALMRTRVAAIFQQLSSFKLQPSFTSLHMQEIARYSVPLDKFNFCADEESTWLHFANILPRWTRWKKMSYNSFVPGSKATIQSCAAGWRRDYIEASKSCTPALFSFNFNYIL